MQRDREKEPKRQTFLVSISELAEANPQVSIYNTVSYQDMVSAFAPALYDPVQLARVQVGEGENSKIIWQIVDGHTKTKFAIDYGSELGITEIEAYDSTQALLANPRIATNAQEGQEVLTMAQYLRAVVEPTRVHQEIAPRRIAAHLINGWESIVGLDLAQRFSATAAMNMLTDIPSGNNAWLLEATLKKLDRLIPDESEEQRAILVEGILQMSAIFQESKLSPRKVHREAFALIASQDPMIGGERQALAEIYGLLNVPILAKKLDQETKDSLQQKLIQEELGKATLVAMSRLKGEFPQIDPSIVSDILLDPDLSVGQTLDTLQGDNIVEDYRAVKINSRYAILAEALLKQADKDDVNEIEWELVERFSQINLKKEQLPMVARAVRSAGVVVSQAQAIIETLTQDADRHIADGVKQTTIERSVRGLSELVGILIQSGSHHQVKLKEKELSQEIGEIAGRINRDKVTYVAQNIVAKDLSPTLQETFRDQEIPPMIQNAAVTYLMNQHEGELSDPQTANVIVGKLKLLDSDLMLKLFDNRMTLAFALQLQRERMGGATQTSVETKRLVSPDVIEHQNVELASLLPEVLEHLSLMELQPENISRENSELAWGIIKKLVKMINGHPNAQRIIEDYPSLLRKITQLQERKTLE